MMFSRYIALGDSMSIDLYPALDAGEIDIAVALERRVDAGAIAPLGAASMAVGMSVLTSIGYSMKAGSDLGPNSQISATRAKARLAPRAANSTDAHHAQIRRRL